MSRLRNGAFALVGGLAVATAFPDAGIWPLAFLGIGLLWVAIAEAKSGAAFGLGFLFGVAFYLPYVVWARVAVGSIPWVALTLACATFIGLACAIFSHVRRAPALVRWPVLAPLAFAVIWVAFETLLGFGPFGGFPWGKLAFAVVDSPMVNLAIWGGSTAVSFTVVLTGALVGTAMLAVRDKRIVAALGASLTAVVLVVAPLGIGLDERAEAGTLTVGWAQGNVPNKGLDSFERARLVTINHTEATLALAQSHPEQIDLMIWPENSSDMDPRKDSETAALVTQAAQAVNAPLLLGSIDLTPPDGRYNVAMVWLPEGVSAGMYRKQQPAAFAEYVPIRDFARIFSPAVDLVTRDVLQGNEPAALPVFIERIEREVSVGTIICFEVAYDWVNREAVAAGAEFLAVQTNNANFGLTAESTQQLAMTRFRAIETGRAALQVSTVGVSGVVTPAGRVLEQTELFTQAYGVAEIPLRHSLTPAVRYGVWIEWGVVALAGAMLAGAWVARVRDEAHE